MEDHRRKPEIPWRALTMVLALLGIWALFTLTTDGVFLTARNLSLLARQMSVTSILAAGMVLVIVAGQIDLSVGALTGLLGAVSAMVFVTLGWPLWAAFATPLALGALFGFLQGFLVARFQVPPFIVTLGGMLLCQGALLGITGGVAISPTPDYLFIGQAFVPSALGWVLSGTVAVIALSRARRERGAGRWILPGLATLALGFTAVLNAYHGIPVPVLLLLGVAFLLSTAASHTPFGRHLYAIGGNREAAFYSGIPIGRRLVEVFTLMGLMAGLAGVVLTARVGAATSDAGRMMELDAIAAAVIGGTSLMGGRGTVWGALLGGLVMASLDNGMSLMNTEAFWQPILKGVILVAAVGVDIAGRKGR
jgi:D-xylose transport system permease protein